MKKALLLVFLVRTSDAFRLLVSQNVRHILGTRAPAWSPAVMRRTSSPVATRHHPVTAMTQENNTVNAAASTAALKQKWTSPQRRNAVIRVSIATMSMFIIASRYTGRSRVGLNAGLSAGLGLFLALIERSRGWVARMRMHATELWQSVEAHYVAADNMDAGGPQLGKKSVAAQEWENAQAAERVTVVGTVVNILLTAFKLAAGIIGKSSAMIADAGHSLSDLFSDIVTLYTVRIARLPADEDHPYGHGRFEALGALAVAGMLTTAAFGFGSYAYESFIVMLTGKSGTASATGPAGNIALVAALVSIISKEALYRATAVVAQRIESQVLLANAWHHRSDSFSSVIALFSIWGASSWGLPALDPLGGLLVAGMVGITGLRVGWSAFMQLTDTQDFELKAAVERAVKKAVSKYHLQDDVLGLPTVRARYLGSRAWVDLEVETNPSRSASAAAQVVRVLKNEIMSCIPYVNDVAVVLKMQEIENVNGLAGLGTERKVESLSDDKAVTVSPKQVEATVRRVLKQSKAFSSPDGSKKRLKSVSNVLVHFCPPQSGQFCDVDVIVSADDDAELTFSEVKALAQVVKSDVIRYADGVMDAKVSLELVPKSEELSLSELRAKKYAQSLSDSFARIN